MLTMDPELIARARGGDRAALETLLERIAPLAHRFGLRMCRHEADAEEVLQETLLSVASHLEQFEGRASLSSWVFMLARTACARRRRGLKNRPHESMEGLEELRVEEQTPELQVADQQLRRAVDDALRRLTVEQREVLLLRDMEGLSAPEVADALGIQIQAVKSRLHRARAALREALRDTLERHAPARLPGCPDVVAAFSRKLEGELGTEDCATMERHVEACPACHAACSSLRAALGACRAEASGEVSPAVKARVVKAMRTLVAELQQPARIVESERALRRT